MFALTYRCHGGSGTNLTLQDVLELDWGRFNWWYDQLELYRSQEAAAIKKANTRKK